MRPDSSEPESRTEREPAKLASHLGRQAALAPSEPAVEWNLTDQDRVFMKVNRISAC